MSENNSALLSSEMRGGGHTTIKFLQFKCAKYKTGNN